MRRYLLDTNHLSAAIKPISPLLDRILQSHETGNRIGTCFPALCETEAGISGIHEERRHRAYRRALRRLFKQVRLWPVGRDTAKHYGRIYQELRSRGRVLSQVDMMLTALARQMDLTILTSDRDFEALPDIRTENWLS